MFRSATEKNACTPADVARALVDAAGSTQGSRAPRQVERYKAQVGWRDAKPKDRLDLAQPVYRELKAALGDKAKARRLADASFPVDPALRERRKACKQAYKALPDLQRTVEALQAERDAQAGSLEAAIQRALAPRLQELAQAQAALAVEREGLEAGKADLADRQDQFDALVDRIETINLAPGTDLKIVVGERTFDLMREDVEARGGPVLRGIFSDFCRDATTLDASGAYHLRARVTSDEFVWVAHFIESTLPARMTSEEVLQAERGADTLGVPGMAEAVRARSYNPLEELVKVNKEILTQLKPPKRGYETKVSHNQPLGHGWEPVGYVRPNAFDGDQFTWRRRIP
ncbi:MAG TPA: hypothetical protein VFH51_14665 [Myxococcota bacterium]|nr:hypothetical protein [Myxococcota bacterium]